MLCVDKKEKEKFLKKNVAKERKKEKKGNAIAHSSLYDDSLSEDIFDSTVCKITNFSALLPAQTESACSFFKQLWQVETVIRY